MSKYDPLSSFLGHSAPHLNDIVLSFDQIEQIIGTTLPPNAHNARGTWWRNTKSRPQSHAWLVVGWRQDIVDWQHTWVRFHRVKGSE
jgi:hypothetical protein